MKPLTISQVNALRECVEGKLWRPHLSTMVALHRRGLVEWDGKDYRPTLAGRAMGLRRTDQEKREVFHMLNDPERPLRQIADAYEP